MKGLLVGLVLVASMPASATTSDEQLDVWRAITFETTASCMTACPYWLDTMNTDIDQDGAEDVRFHACGNPDGTDGSFSDLPGLPYEEGVVYDQIVVGPRPEGALVLIAEIYPMVDWDLFICSEHGEDIPVCPSSSAECSYAGPADCENLLGPHSPVPFGCYERAVIAVAADRGYILRAYNWSDPFPVEGRYCFSSQGSCS